MVVTAWIIGIVIFIFSLITLWGTFFLLLLVIGGLLLLAYLTNFDISSLNDDIIKMIYLSLIAPWTLVLLLTPIIRIFGFVEDVGKAVKNLADDYDDRRR